MVTEAILHCGLLPKVLFLGLFPSLDFLHKPEQRLTT